MVQVSSQSKDCISTHRVVARNCFVVKDIHVLVEELHLLTGHPVDRGRYLVLNTFFVAFNHSKVFYSGAYVDIVLLLATIYHQLLMDSGVLGRTIHHVQDFAGEG